MTERGRRQDGYDERVCEGLVVEAIAPAVLALVAAAVAVAAGVDAAAAHAPADAPLVALAGEATCSLSPTPYTPPSLPIA